MADVRTLIRPDVTYAAAVPATISHPYLHNLTNAALVEVNATDLGRVDVRVGQGRNVNVTLGTETTVAGVGNTVTLRGGDAVGGGPSAGGDIIVQPGAGAGGGATGSFRPLTSGAYTNGTATLAWGTVFGRTFRADNDQGVTLRTVQVGAGTGPTVSVIASDGVGGAGNGGSVLVQAGNPAAAQPAGNITLTIPDLVGPSVAGQIRLHPGQIDGTATTDLVAVALGTTRCALRPAATAAWDVGTAALAIGTTFTRTLRADTGNALAIQRQDGIAWATLSSGTGSTQININTLLVDNTSVFFGNSADAQIVWASASANNALYLATGVNTAAQSGNIILTTLANAGNEHGLAAVATPQLAIFSAADMSIAANRAEHLRIRYSGASAQFVLGANGTLGTYVFDIENSGANAGDVVFSSNNSVGVMTLRNNVNVDRVQLLNAGDNRLVSLNSGANGFTIRDNNNLLYTFIGQVNGVVGHSLTQPVNTSGTPTGLLWTAAAHTTLANGETIDQNWNNARTVQFAGAVLLATQRSFLIQAPTYSSNTATKTITTAATFAITGAPVAGTNVTLTNTLALWVQSGRVRFDSPSGTAVLEYIPTTTGATLFSLLQQANTTGSPTILSLLGGAHTGLSTAEFNDVRVNLGQTKQITTGGGSLGLIRSIRIDAPTYSATAATLTITEASTIEIVGAPAAGANVSITNRYVLSCLGGITIFGNDGSGLGAQIRFRSFHTANPTDPPNDMADMFIFDNGATVEFRVRYRDTSAGATKTGTLVLV